MVKIFAARSGRAGYSSGTVIWATVGKKRPGRRARRPHRISFGRDLLAKNAIFAGRM
jgi:hypothetical protein